MVDTICIEDLNRRYEKCPCQLDEIIVGLAFGDWTLLKFEKDKSGSYLLALGEGEAKWKPFYCPLCGRKL